MNDPMKGLKYRKWIPTIEKLSLHEYERHVLGLSPTKAFPFQMFFHHSNDEMCIHTSEIKLEGGPFNPTMTIGEETVVQQKFDEGGYYLSPKTVKGNRHERGESDIDMR